MNGLELLQKYPKAATVIKNWFMDLMLEGLNNDTLPESFKQFVRDAGMDDDRVGTMINANPRNLFDVLDNNGIYIQISVYKIDDVTLFQYSYNGLKIESITYPSRKLAEAAAVEEGIKWLNQKLEDNEGQDSGTSDREVLEQE